jgi:hypothetical protein
MDHDERDELRDPDRNARGEANRDPITGEPGAHPLGTGLGAAAGAAAGATVGAAIGGPVGAVLGGAIGAVGGGAGGHVAAEAVNPTAEDEYWRSNWSSRPYTDRSRGYEQYQPAYRLGWESRARFRDRRWEDVEPELASEWNRRRAGDRAALKWDEARLAARDAWRHLERYAPGPGPSRERR